MKSGLREPGIMIAAIKYRSGPDLFLIAQAKRLQPFPRRRVRSGEQKPGRNRDNKHNNKELYECKVC